MTDKVAFHQRDLFETDLSQATVITMYLLPRVNMELRPKLLELKPGTRIVSHDFSMEDWKPDTHVIDGCARKVGRRRRQERHLLLGHPGQGRGRLALGSHGGRQAPAYEVTLEQKFQVVSGAARVGGRAVKLQEIRLSGEDLTLHVYRRGERRAGKARVLRQGRGRYHQRVGRGVGRPRAGAAGMERAPQRACRRGGSAARVFPRPLRLAAGVSG